MTAQCTHRKASGAGCMRSARDGETTCALHDPARPKRAPGVAKESVAEGGEAGHGAAMTTEPDRLDPVESSSAAAVLFETAPDLEAWRERMRPAGDDVAASVSAGSSRLYHCDYAELARIAPRREDGTVCDALIVDAPYSARVHEGHDQAATAVSLAARKANGIRDTGRARRTLPYAPWTAADVDAFIELWAPLTRHWICSLTDDGLVPHWRSAYGVEDMIDFAPVPAIESGATVRMHGDGPTNWTSHLCVARKKGPGFIGEWSHVSPYYLGPAESKPEVGGKPIWMMREIVRDYTRPDWIIADPCAGGGATTLLAALIEGRVALGSEPREVAWRAAAVRLGALRDRNALHALRVTSSKAPIERKGQLPLLANG